MKQGYVKGISLPEGYLFHYYINVQCLVHIEGGVSKT